jgi:hypothetical protein
MTNYKTTFEEWDRRVTRAVEAHYESAKKLQRHHHTLGIIALVIVALLGATKEVKTEGVYSAIFYLVSVTAAILVGLQTFLKYGERAEKHKEVASNYGALRRQIEYVSKKTFTDNNHLEECIRNITKEWDALSKSAPAADSKVWTEVKKKYNSATFKSKLYNN